MDEPIYIPRQFTPPEVERFTGVARATQRNWRRYGFIPHHVGHARFQPSALIELWVFGLLGERGIGPDRARKVAGSIALRITAHAECRREAFPAAVADMSLYATAFASCGLARFFAWFPS